MSRRGLRCWGRRRPFYLYDHTILEDLTLLRVGYQPDRIFVNLQIAGIPLGQHSIRDGGRVRAADGSPRFRAAAVPVLQIVVFQVLQCNSADNLYFSVDIIAILRVEEAHLL